MHQGKKGKNSVQSVPTLSVPTLSKIKNNLIALTKLFIPLKDARAVDDLNLKQR